MIIRNNTYQNIDESLFTAVAKGNLLEVENLVNLGADVNSAQHDMPYELCSCLYKALAMGHIEIAEVLIKSGADINLPAYYFACDKDYYSHPIEAIICAEQNLTSGIKLLIKYGLDVHSINVKEAFTLLCQLKSKNKVEQLECCKILIKAGIDINYNNTLNETALFLASVSDNIGIAKLLIEKGAEKNLASCFALDDYQNIQLIQNKDNKIINNQAYVLCKAAYNNNLNILKRMLKFGISLNLFFKDSANNITTPLTSTYSEYTRLWLLQNGADPQFMLGTKRFNPLCKAAISSQIEPLRLLLAAGADPNERWENHTQSPVLHTAVSAALPLEKTKRLLFAGADVHAKDYLQQSVMHALVNEKCHKEDESTYYSSTKEKLAVIDLLLCYKVEPSPKDIRGITPLHLASKNGYGPIILSKLIEIGNDINDKDYNGETPLSVAVASNQKETIKYLLFAGAKTKLTTKITQS